MKDAELIQKLHNVRSVEAAKPLHDKIARMAKDLPDMHTGFYFPLFAFRFAVVGSVMLLILLVTSSGLLVGAKNSSPKTPFYPVKILIHKFAPTFVGDTHVQKTVAPTPTPRLILTSTPSPSPMHLTPQQKHDTHSKHASHHH